MERTTRDGAGAPPPNPATPHDPRRDPAALAARLSGDDPLDLVRGWVEENPNIILVLDRDGRLIHANAAFAAFFGTLPPPDRTIFDDRFLERAGHMAEVRQAFRGETVLLPATHVNPRLIHPALPDRDAHVQSSLHPLRDARGEFRLVVMHMIDVTARVRAEEALHESLATARAILDAPDEPFMFIDRAGRLLDCNGALARVWGREREALLGRDIFSFMEPDHARERRERMERLFRTGTVERFIEPGIGGTVWETGFHPVRDEAGEVVRAVIFTHDITARTRAETLLAQARSLELAGRLAGGVAHDFNNLLTGMLGHLSLLARELSPAGLDRAAKIEGLIERGAALVRQLLGCARGGGGARRRIDLSETARGMLPLFRDTRRGIRVEEAFAAGPLPVLADPVQVEQALLNLLLNAAEAMNDRGLVRVATRLEEPDDGAAAEAGLPPGAYAALEVADEGPGVPPDLLPRIFEPFVSTKAPGIVAGMGLASALGIARAHGGTIIAERIEPRGMRFRLLLPLLDAARNDPERGADGETVER